MALGSLVIESGSSTTAIGPGVSRDEEWTSTITFGKSGGSVAPTTGGTYGFNNSTRLQYSLVFCGNTPYMLVTGNIVTLRAINMSCCA